MSILRRYFQPNQMCFITSITHERQPILVEHADLFWQSVQKIRSDVPFDIYAWVLLPDHFHALLASERGDFSTILKRIKLSFAYLYRQRKQLYRGTVWQARFWDHIIRDEEDLHRHAHYIHYNPVKHGLVTDTLAWPHSSAQEYYEGQGDPIPFRSQEWPESEFGE